MLCTVVTVMSSTVAQGCSYWCHGGHPGDAQGALSGVLHWRGRTAEVVPSGDNCLHILERSAQLRRACFLDKLVYLVRRHAAGDFSYAWELLIVEGPTHSWASL